MISRYHVQSIGSRRALGLLLFLILCLLAVFAPIISPYPPGLMDITKRLLPPSSAHWLGTDIRGMDVLTSLLFGARVSLSMSLLAVLFSHALGTVLGIVAGFYSKVVGQIILRIMDLTLAFPGILLSLALATLLKPSFWTLVIAMTATGWVSVARLVRGEVRKLKEKEFVVASESLGASSLFILRRHILPHLRSLISAHMTLSVASTVLMEAALSFLGLGPQEKVPTWGQLLSDGRLVLGSAPLLTLAPGAAIFCLIFSLHLISEDEVVNG